MAPIQPLQLETYTTDLGFAYGDVKFKLKRGRGELNVDNGCGTYLPSVRGVCASPNRFFKMRALIVTMVDGEKVRLPISTVDRIVACVQALKGNEDVACIDLDGEEWGVIPPTLGGYTTNNTVYQLPTGSKSEKFNGAYDYTSDVLGLSVDKYAIEQNPESISLQLLECLANRREKDRCILTAGVRARHIVVIANGSNNSAIVRKGKVSTLADVLTCVQGLTDRVLCIGYKGESIKNVDLLVPAADEGG